MKTIDFLHPNRQPTAGWLVLSVGLACLAVSSAWRLSVAGLDSIADQKVSMAGPESASALPTATTGTIAAGPSPMAAITPSLTLPWIALFRSLELMTKPPVHLLSLSIDGAAGTLRLEGEAPNLDAAAAYAEAMSGSEVVRLFQLRAVETQVDPGSGQSHVRFSATAEWGAK